MDQTQEIIMYVNATNHDNNYKNVSRLVRPRRTTGHMADSPSTPSSGQRSIGTTCRDGERKVHVIYTGGTIGMVHNDEGVLSPSPNVLVKHLRQSSELNDLKYSESKFGPDGFLVLPTSQAANRVLYDVVEYTPLLDSSDMSTSVWEQIAADVQAVYDKYDGFVILHGTDTMAYTSSALSFMFQDLSKPVILTGSQLPLFDVRSDGRSNFASALIIAGCYPIPEVAIMFGSHLLRGNRTVKSSSTDLNAFESPNCPPLATIGVEIQVNHNIIRPCVPDRPLIVRNLSSDVGLLRIFPEMTTKVLRHFLQPPLRGIILQTYGAGNMPATRKDVLKEIEEATKSGLLILNCTQCSRGNVAAMYTAGDVLEKMGVVCGADMTVEAALAKLAYVLERNDWSMETKRRQLRASLRGELTPLPPPPVRLTEVPAHKNGEVTMCSRLLATAAFTEPALGPGLAALVAGGSFGRDDALRTLHELQNVAVNVITGRDADGRTPLHAACRAGHTEVVIYLLKLGAKPDVPDRLGHTPLLDAVLLDRHDIIKIITSKSSKSESLTNGKCNGAKQTTSPYWGGENLNYLSGIAAAAAAAGDKTRLQSLRLAGFSLEAPDHNGRTPLHIAALHGQQDIVSFLLEANVDRNRVDFEDRKAIDIAGSRKHENIVKLLE